MLFSKPQRLSQFRKTDLFIDEVWDTSFLNSIRTEVLRSATVFNQGVCQKEAGSMNLGGHYLLLLQLV